MKQKKNSILKSLLVFCLLVPCMLFFTACSKEGKSAYDLAVEQGFVGSLDEWLESLKGNDGQNGQNGQNGLNGTNGQDAIQETSYDMYLKAKELGEFDGEYIDFVRDVLNIQESNQGIVANNCLASVVTIKTDNSASSTGVIYKMDAENNAYIVTNYHCIQNPTGSAYQTAKLNLYGRDSSQAFTATYVGGSKKHDLALLYVENNSILADYGAKPVTINTNDVIAGSECFAIGNALGKGLSITSGCISISSELMTISVGNVQSTLRVIRHSAYTAKGNSGGGLFNANGELIGITNGGLSTGQTDDKMNLIKSAVPASIVKGFVENLIGNDLTKPADERTKGLTTLDFGFEFYATNKTINTDGIIEIVETIKVSSVTGTNNLIIGDKIVSLTLTNGINSTTKTISRDYHVTEFLMQANPNQTLKIEVERAGETENIIIEIDLSSQ